MNYFLLFMTPMITTLLLVPPIKRLAIVTGAIDEPDERRVHKGRVPRLGGLAMFFGFLLTFLIYFNGYTQYRGIFIGMFIVVIIGLIDDSLGLDPRLKFLGQIVAALAAMVLSDVNINFLGGVLGSNYSLGWLSWPLTVFWIVGITNAINLSDGLDGLASGISLIAFTSFGFLAYQRDDVVIFSLCLVLVGCILGFLKYNTHPAEVFMGDTGSLFLGYFLGTLSIAGNFKSLTTMTLILPVLVLLVPISDTLWAIVRRLREGRSPFSADKKHFHHKLLNYGMDQSQTVSVIYGISAALSICAVALANSGSLKYMLIPLLVLGAAGSLAHAFGMIDLWRWTDSTSHFFEKLFPFEMRTMISNTCLKMLYVGSAIYLIAFLAGIPVLPRNHLFIVSTTVVLFLFLFVTRGANGQSFTIFSLFFLAAAMVLVINFILSQEPVMFGLNVAYLETTAMTLLIAGVLGKLFFKKKKEIFLSTPLEFFIFLVVLSIAIVPENIRTEFNLVGNVMRTFLLFMAFKIIALTTLDRIEAKGVSAPKQVPGFKDQGWAEADLRAD